ncbi:MAG: hypothetical protein BGO38_05030 [Cellulomonas sp. 73-145]|nr:MAG: hypothetical protein BGO38_05030 [Cellulomonas sp. 73-145]
MLRALHRGRRDEGIAIVAAMGVVLLVGILVAVTVSIALGEAKGTGRDRQRSSAIATAESTLDVLTAQIQSSDPTGLQAFCAPVSSNKTVAGDTFSVASTVTYYDASGNAIPCASLPSTVVAQAKLTASATPSKASVAYASTRKVESLLKMTPAYANNLDKALFSQSSMTMSNKTVLTSASATPNADVYTNGDFTCNNNEEFHGSIYAQGSIYLNSQCTVSVDVWANNNVSATNPSASIGGRALATTGSITLTKAALGQQARAKGTVTGDICATAGKCFGGVLGMLPPPNVPFPQIDWNAAAQSMWVNEGYTNIVTFDDTSANCNWYTGPSVTGADGHTTNLNGKADVVGAWLYGNAYRLPAPTIVIDRCSSMKITLQGIGLTMNKNLVLLSLPGIAFTGNTTITSVAGTGTASNPNLLYFIQPWAYYETPVTCNGEGITLDNQVTVDNTVNTLLYSPCAIRKANQSQVVGQVYSGSTLTVDNQLNMTYVPLPVWGGLVSSNVVKSYAVQTMYKHEVQ